MFKLEEISKNISAKASFISFEAPFIHNIQLCDLHVQEHLYRVPCWLCVILDNITVTMRSM